MSYPAEMLIVMDSFSAARLDVDALPTPSSPTREKDLPPVPYKPPPPAKHDSMDDADPSLPGAWRHSHRRKTVLPPLDVTPSGLHFVESIDSRLGTPLVRQGPRGPPLRRPSQHTPQSARRSPGTPRR